MDFHLAAWYSDKWNALSRFCENVLLEFQLKINLITFSHHFPSVFFVLFLTQTGRLFFITAKLADTFALILSRWWQKISGHLIFRLRDGDDLWHWPPIPVILFGQDIYPSLTTRIIGFNRAPYREHRFITAWPWVCKRPTLRSPWREFNICLSFAGVGPGTLIQTGRSMEPLLISFEQA